MFISKSNILKGTSPIVTTGVGVDLPSNVTSSDFSLNYNAGSSIVIMQLGAAANINYVAASAANVSQVTIFQAGSEFLNVDLTRDNVVMFAFPTRTFTDLRIRFRGIGTQSPTINHIAAGAAIEIPNGGENSGYNRNYLTRNINTRTVSSNLAAPITSLQVRTPLKGNLTLPNMTTEFVTGEWQELLDFLSTGQVFYISEQADTSSNDAAASYACYSPQFKAPTAHQSTRALNNISLGFNCYNGL